MTKGAWIQPALRASAKRLRLGVAGERNAELLERIDAIVPLLQEALSVAARHCPCGARPESPLAHPHVPGCKVAAALAALGEVEPAPARAVGEDVVAARPAGERS